MADQAYSSSEMPQTEGNPANMAPTGPMMDFQTQDPSNMLMPADPLLEQLPEPEYGPRKMSFFTLVLKTFAGLIGGIAGTMILLMIFLLTSSILQPVLSPAETAANEVSPLFVFVLMAMIFATSLISSLVAPLLLSYTERDRYDRVSTALSQIFIINIVIFAFLAPIYLTASSTRLELTAFAAGLQVLLSATASTLIMELIHDYRYSLLTVYKTILAILVSTAFNLIVYTLSGSGGATVLLFISLPVTWTMIGFFQGALTMFYYWVYQNYGIDFLAASTSYGRDYGLPEESDDEENSQPEQPDVEGENFFK